MVSPLPSLTTGASLTTVARVPFAARLALHGERVAVVAPEGTLTYTELAERVDEVVRRLGPTRRLVLVAGGNAVEPLVTYLAALAAGHPVLLAPGDKDAALDTLVAAYDPDVVASASAGEWRTDERREGTAHELHPDLALLLSTSGSTGSPKLVRLSHENVQSNAEAIASYLGLSASDRAVTTLPMHYCYGLSVLNSHLLRGAGVVLSGLSVVDPCFWDLFRRTGATSFAGVPHTFDLLERAGFAEMDLPHLRYVTQAGGRLAPDKVLRFAELGRRRGWDLVVMYGQTEATARMAYLPPHLAGRRPEAVGVPIPGGSFRIDPVPDGRHAPGPHAPGPHTAPAASGAADGTGELVYSGPNVMLGYAHSPADLALGRTVRELRTGDLARRAADGLYEVVGRTSRFAKVFGLRIDLERVESLLAADGFAGCCVGADDELVVAVEAQDADDLPAVRRAAATASGLPQRSVRVLALDPVPRLATGKPDYRAIAEQAAHPAAVPGARPAAVPAQRQRPDGDEAALCALYAQLLDRPDVTPDSTFVGLGGDSLSYVEMSLRLERALGHLPAGWHLLPIRELAAAPAPARRRGRGWTQRVETTLVLRALAIVLIVGTHAKLFALPGGAHVLLAVAGFNFARFPLAAPERLARVRNALGAVARVAVPSMGFIAAAALLTGRYELPNVLLLNHVLGPDRWGPTWHFWFVEALVAILLVVVALLAVPAVHRAEGRWPFWLPMSLVALGLVTRFDLVVIETGPRAGTAQVVFWLFALGWAAARAERVWQRLLVSLVALAAVPGFFDEQPLRELVLAAGLLVLVWVPTVRAPRPLALLVGLLAGASLHIYLVHWLVYPELDSRSALLAVVASLGAGLLYAAASRRVGGWVLDGVRRVRPTGALRPPVAPRRTLRRS